MQIEKIGNPGERAREILFIAVEIRANVAAGLGETTIDRVVHS